MAEYLQCDVLLNFLVPALAIHIKGKSDKELRTLLDLPDDLTDAAKERIREENRLCDYMYDEIYFK